MNAKSAASGATAAIVPGVVIVGTALIVQTIVGLAAERDHLRAQAQARPTVTVTPSIPPPSTTAAPTPEPRPSGDVATAVGVVMTAERHEAAGSATETSGGEPAPQEVPPSAEDCPRGQVLTINLPLGLLPCDSAVIGGRDPQPTEGP
ncbi:MAG: hypothetical protein ACRDQ2_11895 [Gaiellales bacterium]